MSATDSCLYLSKMTYGLKKIQKKKIFECFAIPILLDLNFFQIVHKYLSNTKRFKNIKCDLCIVRFYRYKDLVYFSLFFIFSQCYLLSLCISITSFVFNDNSWLCKKRVIDLWLKCTKHINIMITIINICIVMISFFWKGQNEEKLSLLKCL